MENLDERLKPAPEAKFFFAISSAQPERQIKAENLLQQQMGPFELCSVIYCLSEFSDYYDAELGGRSWKYFISIKKLRPADDLVPIKLAAEEIQIKLAKENDSRNRTVNIDPGYINGWQVVLSTVKNFSPRIYLSEGVFAEVTLIYRKKSFLKLPWTYPIDFGHFCFRR